MLTTLFDSELDKVLRPKAKGKVSGLFKYPARLQKKLDKALAEADADPVAWVGRHREDVQLAARRPRIARKLAEEVPEFTEQEHSEFLTRYLEGTNTVGMSEEQKAKWHLWINRVIPVLKVISAVVPPPYNLAIIALIVVLTLIDQNRLQPAELAAVFNPAPLPESTPALAV